MNYEQVTDQYQNYLQDDLEQEYDLRQDDFKFYKQTEQEYSNQAQIEPEYMVYGYNGQFNMYEKNSEYDKMEIERFQNDLLKSKQGSYFDLYEKQYANLQNKSQTFQNDSQLSYLGVQYLRDNQSQNDLSRPTSQNNLLNEINSILKLNKLKELQRERSFTSNHVNQENQNEQNIPQNIPEHKPRVKKQNKSSLLEEFTNSQNLTQQFLNDKTRNYLNILQKHLQTPPPFSSINDQTKRLSNIYKNKNQQSNKYIPISRPQTSQGTSFIKDTRKNSKSKTLLNAQKENTQLGTQNFNTQESTLTKNTQLKLQLNNAKTSHQSKDKQQKTQLHTQTLNKLFTQQSALKIQTLTQHKYQPSSITPNITKKISIEQQQHSSRPKSELSSIESEQGESPYLFSNILCQEKLFNIDLTLGLFRLENELGKGSYASVKLAVHKKAQKKFALKIYPKYVLSDPTKLKNVKREIQILRKLQHPNLIKMPFAFEDKSSVVVGMEYVGKISLYQYLKQRPDRRIDESEARKFFRQMVEGIRYCHSKSVVHRDIKLENMLLDGGRNIKIIDFGFSIVMPTDKKLKIFCGTPSYMSPEIVSKIEYLGQKADIWALGIVLFVISCGRFPFKGFNDNDLFKKIKYGKIEFPVNMSDDLKRLLNKILRNCAADRPSAQQILEDPWFYPI